MDDKLYHYMNWPLIEEVVYAEEDHPQEILGPHKSGMNLLFQTYQPGAQEVSLLLPAEEKMLKMEMADESGFFAVCVPYFEVGDYQYEVTWADGHKTVMQDPYRFAPLLTREDLARFHAGIHESIYEKLGAHLMEREGVKGCDFAVWAPGVERVSVVGDFNGWNGGMHQMMRLENGVFELFIPGVQKGELYKFECRLSGGRTFMKADPYSRSQEAFPGTASVVCEEKGYHWHDADWIGKRRNENRNTCPVSIYECSLYSFRKPKDGSMLCSYRDNAEVLVKYVKKMGYTHVQLMPLMEYQKDETLGYQTFGYYAPTARYGSADELRMLVDALHQAGIGVLMDFTPCYFPPHEEGLSDFDGTPLYECKDTRRRWYEAAGALRFDFASREVRNFLLGSVLYWLQEFHLDGIRLIDLASMLYLDYGCADGVYISNIYGDNVNLEGVEFLRHLNAVVHKNLPGAVMIADETTGWPGVTDPQAEDGLGFDWKWNTGWKNDTLEYISYDPFFRSYHQDELTNHMAYAYRDRFVLPLSHNEVEHGKPSLFGRMPGKPEEKFAELRLLYSYQTMHPGRKLLFMGQDLAEPDSWSEMRETEWYLEACENNGKLQKLVADLNGLYRAHPALYELDDDPEGFVWVDCVHAQDCRISFLRRAAGTEGMQPEELFVFCNFANVMKIASVGVPKAGKYKEIFNSDAEQYGGSGFCNPRAKKAVEKSADGQSCSLKLNIAPLSVMVFQMTEA